MSRIRHNLPIFKEKRYRWFMHTVDTALVLDSNPKVTFRLRCIHLLEKCGWEAVNTAFPGVSRASVYRWKRVYEQSGRKYTSLLPGSTRPNKLRQMVIPKGILVFIKEIRGKYPHLSKYKIKPFLDVWCKEQEIDMYSVSWIGKVISRNNFFFDIRKTVRKRRRRPRRVTEFIIAHPLTGSNWDICNWMGSVSTGKVKNTLSFQLWRLKQGRHG